MKLIEREASLSTLYGHFEDLAKGEGHCILVSGEAGIGKSSLIKVFCDEFKNACNIYRGTCDALFTPRALAPLYDVAMQMHNELLLKNWDIADRAKIFAMLLKDLGELGRPSIVVFEDIHWADGSTLDFIKLLARRITHLPCLFVLSFRDDEVHSRHPLRNVLGQLSRDAVTRLQLPPLSAGAVESMASAKGYNGKEVYKISGGNPFYVTEILASYSPGIPDNIRDAILAVYNDQTEETRHLWEVLSVHPTGLEIKYLEKIMPDHAIYSRNALDTKIFILKNGGLFFKHELYRRTIEAQLSPMIRIALNKDVLELCLDDLKQNGQTERIIHHATNAQVEELIAFYAPLAAKKASLSGAHAEASRLYLLAISYNNNNGDIVQLYECYAYECYLTNQLREAIDYSERALAHWKEQKHNEKIADSLQFLSRLWWFDGNSALAEKLGKAAVDVIKDNSPSQVKAMSYSNMAQLKMLADKHEECLEWGEEASKIAEEINDLNTLAHAYNTMGSALMTLPRSKNKGRSFLTTSLDIALKNGYHEHTARAYTALGSNGVTIKDYAYAKEMLDSGIAYCEEHDLYSLKLYMLAWRSRLDLETGNWEEARDLAHTLLQDEDLLPVIKIGALTVLGIIKMRCNEEDALTILLQARSLAFKTSELYRILPIIAALLEYEWINNTNVVETDELNKVIRLITDVKRDVSKSRFRYWLSKVRGGHLSHYYSDNTPTLEAKRWKQLGCMYEHALAEFDESEAGKRRALGHMQELGALAVYEKLKKEMRVGGLSIPYGRRKMTRSNAAFLTEREIDVLQLLKIGLKNKEIADQLFISSKTVDHHISAILTKLDVNSRGKAVQEAISREILV